MNQARRLAAILVAEVVGYSRTRKAQSRRRTPASKELKGGFLTERPNGHQIGNGSSPPRADVRIVTNERRLIGQFEPFDCGRAVAAKLDIVHAGDKPLGIPPAAFPKIARGFRERPQIFSSRPPGAGFPRTSPNAVAFAGRLIARVCDGRFEPAASVASLARV
jgi:hypothetical protein